MSHELALEETHSPTESEAVENQGLLTLPGLTQSRKRVLWDQNGLLSGNSCFLLLFFIFFSG